MQNIKITSAEEFALHALISVLAGATLAGITAAGGLIYTQGVNVPVLVTAGLGGFSAAFGAGFLAFRNNPQTKQAEVDAAGQAQQVAASVEARLVPQIESRFQGLLNFIGQSPAQPPVVVNVQHPAQTVPTPAQVQVTPQNINAAVPGTAVQPQFISALPDTVRHFGDTGIIPVVPPK